MIKTFRKHLKSNKFVCIKSSFQFMHTQLYPFCRNSKISQNSSYKLSDIYYDRPKNCNIIIKCKSMRKYMCICYNGFTIKINLLNSIRVSKMEGVPI